MESEKRFVMWCGLAARLLELPAMILAAGAVSDPLDACNVAWDSPSKNSPGLMPIGNGDIGMNAWLRLW
jgi:hypothetical protein